MQINVKKLNPHAILPTYATEGAACFDLYSTEQHQFWLTAVIPTGLAFEIPENHVMLIFSRSGHGFKDNVRLANCVGVIDSDYRGEVKVKLTRDDDQTFEVSPGDRIAQAMILPVHQVAFNLVEKLGETARGEGGFGSSGR